MERKDNYWLRKKIGRRRFVASSGAAVAGAAAFTAVGCGDDDDDTNGDATTAPTGTGTATSTASATGTATQAARPAPTGTLRVSVASLMDQSGDPFFQTGGLARPVDLHAFGSFFRPGDDGQREFDLAEKLEVSPDRMQLTFKMRPNVKFWDGTTVKAQDSAWSFQGYMGRTPPNPSAAALGRQVESVTATDDSTLVIKLKAPTAFEGREITFWNTSSQAHYEKVGADAFKENSMGTGPFKITKNEKGQFMEMEAHEGHWNPNRIPFAKTLRFQLVPELTTRIAQLKTGESSVIEGVTGATALQLSNEPNIKIVTGPQTAWLKLNFFEAQEGTAPWTDKRLREALVISIDQEGITKGLLRQGTPSPNVQLWPKTLCYDEKLFPARKYDINRAKQLVQEAGLQGFSFPVISYTSSSYPLIPEVAQAMAASWKEIGLNPQISQQESGAYFAAFTSRALKGVGVQGWPFSPDGRVNLVLYFKTGSAFGSTDNYQFIDDNIAKMVASTNNEEQIKIAQDVYKYAYDEFLFGGAPWSDSQWAVSDKVKNWIRPAGDPYMTRLESVELTS